MKKPAHRRANCDVSRFYRQLSTNKGKQFIKVGMQREGGSFCFAQNLMQLIQLTIGANGFSSVRASIFWRDAAQRFQHH
ncbi:TPA: hypothetical protein MI478_12150 [Klebsiella pneumoniae]|nr:hypothetical protein [Klebsiella pneumoniae]